MNNTTKETTKKKLSSLLTGLKHWHTADGRRMRARECPGPEWIRGIKYTLRHSETWKKIAWRHFYPEGNGYAKPGYVLHHKDDTLRVKDPKRYARWIPEDLVMLTRAEHTKLHRQGKYTNNRT